MALTKADQAYTSYIQGALVTMMDSICAACVAKAPYPVRPASTYFQRGGGHAQADDEATQNIQYQRRVQQANPGGNVGDTRHVKFVLSLCGKGTLYARLDENGSSGTLVNVPLRRATPCWSVCCLNQATCLLLIRQPSSVSSVCIRGVQ